ncbi:MAG: LamG domain-containing protein [Candidatus Thorarchaeota archaeon]
MDYKSVWHFSEASGTGDYIKDSTSNDYDGTPFGTQFSGTSIIDGARYFTGSGDNRILINSGSEFFNGDSTFTFSFWVYPNYATDAEMEATEGAVFYKLSSVRMNRFWRLSVFPPGTARYQSDIQFVTYGTTYNNVEVNRLEWNYITYSYDGTYLKTYNNGQLGPSTNIGGYSLIADTSSFYLGGSSNSFKGYLDEFHVLDSYRSDGWVATEYNNQYNPNAFFNISSEKYSKPIVEVDVLVNALDLYGNLLSNVTISMYQHLDLIEQDITGIDGSVSFTNIIGGAYNFTATIQSNLGDNVEIVNSTSQAIMLDQAFQTINLICDVSTHFFEVIDVDLIPVESGWIIVGNATHQLQKCIIDPTGHTKFWWVNATPSTYNYTIYYKSSSYNPPMIELASGYITTVNATIQVQVELTTIDFIVQTINTPITPVSGAKLKLTLNNPLGPTIVNLTTNINGQATLRWLTSLEIGGDYSLQIEFFGVDKFFNQSIGGPADVTNISLTVTTKDSLEFRISIDLSKFQTELISLNPTDYIEIEWGTLLKLRTLFNVSKVETGYQSLLGPVYADSMSYTLLLGGITVISGAFSMEENNDGRHFVDIDTTQLDSAKRYIIIISAYKSGYTIPSDRILQLNILENQIELNQSSNDDSDLEAYWLESVNMTLNSYGSSSETLTVENLLFQSIDHEFDFLISDIETYWNLSKIVLNLYNISWNADLTDINVTIKDPYGTFAFTFDYNNSGWNYAQGTWTGITLNLNRASRTDDNNFEFLISGTFDNTIDIIADAYFIRDKINVQYSKFNISSEISLLAEIEGWVISNITFEIFECYDSSDWSIVDLSSLTNINITTNEGFTYSLDYGYLDGTGSLSMDDRNIYPIGNQFLFTVESDPNIIFNAVIKVEYTQGFYKNQYLETLNCTKVERGITNGGSFQMSASGSDWRGLEATLWVKSIKSGSNYYFPSEIAMNITIGGQKYSIFDYALGIGTFSLSGFSKEQLLHAVIETSIDVDFILLLSIQYSRTVSYEIIGSLSYSIVEKPSIHGSVQYSSDLEYYLNTIDTSLLDADEYIVRFTINKPHYQITTKDLNLVVLNRPTLLNQSSEFFRKIESVYVKDAVNFTFVYTDAIRGNKIINLKTQYYVWERYDREGNVIESGYGDIISTTDNTYILDFNTESRALGEYFLIAALEKENYDRKNAMIILNIKRREIGQPILGDNFQDKRTNVVKGNPVPIRITLTDPTKEDSWLLNATITLTIRGQLYNFTQIGNGTYIYNFPTYNINAFFTSNTLTGIINITKENYISQEFNIIIVVEMEQIFPGVPTFYFLLILSAALAIAGSIVGYRVVHYVKTPVFVRKVKEMKKSIKKGKNIDESLLYRNKEAFIVEKVNYLWNNLDLSLAKILDIKIEKIKKGKKLKKRASDIAKVHELKPVGLVLMKWNERIGTELVAKYPEDTVISEKTCMQIYSTHEYSGEKGTITLTVGPLNIISYYTGPEQGYYLLLILDLEDDPDLYEGGMADVLRNLLEHVEDDSFTKLMPSYFQRLSLYPSFSDEEILALTYQDDAKRMIIDNLRETGVISKSELDIWFKDKYTEEFIDIEATVSDLLKKGIIKQFSVKGLLSELIVLIYDFFMLRVPPLDLIEDPINRGLPTQFKKEYLDVVKKFFQSYIPTNEDNLKIVKLLSNPQVHLTLRLLRSAIVSRQDLEKLKVKGVADPYSVIKALWENQMIAVFRDEMNNEYYALLCDFYIDLMFPKYMLEIVKTSYEQKSLTDKVLIEYLEILEDIYYNLKSDEKK